MWQVYALLASDLIEDRYREATATARRHALAGNPGRDTRPLGLARRVPVWTLRRLEAVAVSVAYRAQLTASRLERPAAGMSDPAC